MIPRRRKPAPLGLREAPQIRCPSHLTWLRGFTCSVAEKDPAKCGGKIEAAHCRVGTDGGLSVKPSDIWAIPLCSVHHQLQHSIGEPAFEKRYGINMKEIARKLAAISPHRGKWAS